MRDEPCFSAVTTAQILRQLADSAKTIDDTIHLQLDWTIDTPVVFWAIQKGDLYAMRGKVDVQAFQSLSGHDDGPVSVEVPAKPFLSSLGSFSPKHPVRLDVLPQDEGYLLVLGQGKDGGDTGVDEQTLAIKASSRPALTRKMPRGSARAEVDLDRFKKVLVGMGRHGDVVRVEVRPRRFRVSVSNKGIEQDWDHPTDTVREASVLFAVKSLGAVLAGAVEAGATKGPTVGRVTLAEGKNPMRVEAAGGHVSARYYVANREAMR